jgi:hypothetical protein
MLGSLQYVGIAPRHMRPRVSRQSLRTRIRYHFRGNAAGSTLRLTLGCLLGLERYTATVVGGPETTEYRSTHVFRLEDGYWRAVHRHADRQPIE